MGKFLNDMLDEAGIEQIDLPPEVDISSLELADSYRPGMFSDIEAAAIQAVLSKYLNSAEFEAMFQGYVIPDDFYTIILNEFSRKNVDVTVTPAGKNGLFNIRCSLNKVATTFTAHVLNFIPVGGLVNMSTVVVNVGARIKGLNKISVTSATAKITGFTYEVQWLPSFLENLILPTVVNAVEVGIAMATQAKVGDILASYRN